MSANGKTQAKITVYSKDSCPYCVAAKNFLAQKGIAFTEINVQNDQEQYQQMLQKCAPRRTVPQIFVGELGIGGFTDMKKLEDDGLLEAMLFPS